MCGSKPEGPFRLQFQNKEGGKYTPWQELPEFDPTDNQQRAERAASQFYRTSVQDHAGKANATHWRVVDKNGKPVKTYE